jgi:bacterial/archaeal transporter family-2 protein
MPNSNWIFYLWVVAAGVSLGLQQVLNAKLRFELGSPWLAGLASYAVGTLAMIVAILLTATAWPTAATLSRTSWSSWGGGLLGAIFIATVILTLPRLGAATVLALIVVGQMLGSLVVDHYGLFGVAQQSASPIRLAGAALLILGVVLVRW